MEHHISQPSKRIAQHKLAYEVLEIVHGPMLAMEASQQHRSLFPQRAAVTPPAKPVLSSNPDVSVRLNPKAPQTTFTNAPSPRLTLPYSLIWNQPMSRVLWSAGLVSSRSEGHRLCQKEGAYIGSRPGDSGAMGDQLDFTPAKNWVPSDTNKYIIDNELLILRVGKWKMKVIKIVSDGEFERMGLTAPGWKENDEQIQISSSGTRKFQHSERMIIRHNALSRKNNEQ